MRQWIATPTERGTAALTELVGALGDPGFAAQALAQVRALLPAASLSIYRLGTRPALLMTASTEAHDRTVDCWRAYLSGPIRTDRSLDGDMPGGPARPRVCHVVASEVAPEHRARVYEAHGMAERVSVVRHQADGALLAINFYRHLGQRAFGDAALQDFGEVAGAVLALTEKQLALRQPIASTIAGPGDRDRLLARCPTLTPRELDVCERLLRGLTHDGIAADLGLTVPTVKTYRNRAFQRLGIHFRNELFARLRDA